MKIVVSVLILLVLGTALGNPPRRYEGVGAAKGLSGRISPYIIGGVVVQGREYPGQVSLRHLGGHNCGGSIINENYVLTAAHCSQHDPSDLTVLSGTNDFRSGGTVNNVLEVHSHEKYNPYDSWCNDIAVWKVETPFVFDNVTSPVTLPPMGQAIPVGIKATVVGWGLMSENGTLSRDLRKAEIFISDHDVCEQAYQTDGFKIYPEQICAGTPEGNVGSCYGDSGGPLFANGLIIGLVSWAKGCDEKGFPTIYTDVADYIDWIESKINA